MTTATAPSTTATTDTLDELDFAPSCHAYSKSKGETCSEPAIAYIEFHRVNDCKNEECNARGNMEGNVCQEHLDFFMQTAVDIITNPPMPPLIASLYRAHVQVICATCRMTFHQASDILQKVIRL